VDLQLLGAESGELLVVLAGGMIQTTRHLVDNAVSLSQFTSQR